jgi:uncharacterized protein YciI
MKARRIIFLLAFAMCAWSTRGETPPAGTRVYYLVFIRPDPARTARPLEERQKIMDRHMAYIHKMADDGVLAAAGPFDDTPVTISGIFVIKANSLEEAQAIAAKDPTVTEHRNTIDTHPWRTPPGIGDAYFKWKKENPKAEDAMASHVLVILGKDPKWKDSPGSAQTVREFIERAHQAGVLAVAGMIDDDPVIAAVCVFKAASIDDARKYLAGDPALAQGAFPEEFHVWWSADRVLPW